MPTSARTASVLLLLCLSLSAGVINSGDGMGFEANSITGPNVLITSIHPSWEPNHAAASWISYVDSGWPGGLEVPNSDLSTPTVSFFELYESFAGASGFLNVWADDTAQVFINGLLAYEKTPILDSACAAGVIGCEPNEHAAIDLSMFTIDGANVIQIDLFQIGLGPTGVMYEGFAEDPIPTPEPAMFWLLAVSLFGLNAMHARMRRGIRGVAEKPSADPTWR